MDAFQLLVDELGSADSKEAAVRSFLRYLLTAQTPHFAYLGFQRGPGEERVPFRAGSYPAAWITEYMAAELYSADPVVLQAATSAVPITWSLDLPLASASRGTTMELFERAAAHGIRSGYTVPIRSSLGHLATMTFASPLPWRQFEREVARMQSQFHLASFYFHAAIERILTPAERPMLTERERLCLALASQGLTTKESARTIKLSPRTVRFHLDNARAKLGAVNLSQAIVSATCAGVI
ncbi:hypothetical protein HMF7854_11165 [Sphingomonas ginkgonis]|uniref:HTH luxR-type domain-containing protein n=1 Tax=Sphingomonas ginkgonis TaxID=2315330 RepID=A0A429VBT5_9SPHN|nr:LuxR family transcriptional regulator [Sphingomonas ginkgonis]RST31336.1 hypothetical protein HMF7854_11165 [Sphingomonas ginkgonis]